MATPDDLDSDEFADLDESDDLTDIEEIPIDDDSDLADLAVDENDDEDESGASGDDEADSETADDDSDEDLDDDDDPDGQEESLDVILAREQDLEDEFAPAGSSVRGSTATTPAGEDEFTCRSCFLVKRRAQLADGDELICLDCA